MNVTARRPVTAGNWTGRLGLDVRNGRDWAAGALDLAVGRDTVTVRHQGRMLAVLDRDRFRDWLRRGGSTGVLQVDDTAWSVRSGVTCLSVGVATYTVTPESMANLMTVV
jgi:hypothetical protein